MAQEEAAVLHTLLELLVVVALVDACIACILGLLEDILLYFVQQVLDVLLYALHGDVLLLQGIAAHNLHQTLFQIAGTQNQTHGHTLQFVVGKLESGTLVVGIVVLHAHAHSLQVVHYLCGLGIQLLHLCRLAYGDYHHLYGSQCRRQHQTVVVGVGHYQSTHQACAHAPTGSPGVFGFVLLVQELHIKGLAEVLTQEVACAALQGLAVLHHGLYGVCVQSTGKALGLALHALHHGHGHVVLGKVGIHLQHLACTLLGLLACGMCGVSLLPQELCGTQEQTCTHFPAHNVAPLVHQQRQVAVGLYPVLKSIPDDCLRGGTDNQFLLQTCRGVYHHTVLCLVGLQAVVSHHGTFLGETLHVLGLARQETLGDKQGEVGILHTRLLELIVQHALHLLPDGIAIGLYHHATAHITLFGQIGLHHQFVVPLRIVLTSLCEEVKFFCHILSLLLSATKLRISERKSK